MILGTLHKNLYSNKFLIASLSLNSWRPYEAHDDVIKWKIFPRNWPFLRGIHRSPVNSPHKGQWHGALMFSLICVWINDWVNNREAGDLRCYRAHYDVIVMIYALVNIIGLNNDLPPVQCQAMIWTNPGTQLIRHWEQIQWYFSQNTTFFYDNGFENVICDMAAMLSQPQYDQVSIVTTDSISLSIFIFQKSKS